MLDSPRILQHLRGEFGLVEYNDLSHEVWFLNLYFRVQDILNNFMAQLLMTVFVLDFLDYHWTVFMVLSQIVLESLMIPLVI